MSTSAKTSAKIFPFLKRFFQNQSGVSVVFGALLLFSICVVFLSVFLVYAVPAWEMYRESEENDSLYLSVIQFSNTLESFPRQSVSAKSQGFLSLPSSNATVFTDPDGEFLFSADLSLPPESEMYLKTESSIPGYYVLSRGSVIFFDSYHQLPDQFYFVGPSSLLLCQNEGASFIHPLSIRFVRGSDGQILLLLSGQIFKCDSAPIFGKKKIIQYRETKTVEIHDFVSEFEIRYAPSLSDYSSIHSVFYENKDIAMETRLFDFGSQGMNDFPEIEIVYKDEISSLIISSEVPIEVDICVTEFEIIFE